MESRKCSKCGETVPKNSDKCSSCNTILDSHLTFFDINGDGQVDYKDAIEAGTIVARKTAGFFNDVVDVFTPKPQDQKDKEDLDKRVELLRGKSGTLESEAQKQCDMFKAALEHSIEVMFAETMKNKEAGKCYLTYVDAKILTGKVRGIFNNAVKIVPLQVEAACQLSEAVLAPSNKEKQVLIKSAAGTAGGAAGIGMVIAGVGSALGWGASVTASVITFFTGASLMGPIGWVVAGLGIATIAGYFAFSDDVSKNTERFLDVFKSSLGRSVDAIWGEYGEDLSHMARS